MFKEKTMFAAFVALFAILGGAFVVLGDTDDSDAISVHNGTASMTVQQGATVSYTWAQANSEITGDFCSHTYDIGVGTTLSPSPQGGHTVSGITVTYSSTGITISATSAAAVGTYYIVFDDMTTEDDTSCSSFTVTAPSSGTTEEDLSFTSTAPTQGITGSSYSYSPATNVPANFSKSGTWPSWLTLNTTTGKVTGTLPTVQSSQTYTFKIHAVSKTLSSNTADQTNTIIVYPVATITATGGNTVSGITGQSLSKSLSCNLSATFAVKSGSNSLPAGLSISNSGVISGTPTQSYSSYKVTIQGTTASNAGPVQHPTIVITFNIAQAEDTLQITSTQPSGIKKVGDSVSYSLAANVIGTTFTLVNAPSWLSIDSNNYIRGSVPSTYTTQQDITFTIRAQSPQGQTATQTPTITIQPTLKFTSKPTAECIVIPIYSYADDGTVDAGIIDDLKEGFHSVTDKRIVGYQFVFVGTNADSVAWDFGDGTEGEGFTVEHTYTAAGTYTVTCTATNEYEDDHGNTVTGTDTCTVEVTVDAEAGDYIYSALLIFVGIVVVALVLKLIVSRRH